MGLSECWQERNESLGGLHLKLGHVIDHVQMVDSGRPEDNASLKDESR